MRADLIGQLDDGGNPAYLLGVDAVVHKALEPIEASTAQTVRRRRPRSWAARQESIARLTPYAQANSEAGRIEREKRRK